MIETDQVIKIGLEEAEMEHGRWGVIHFILHILQLLFLLY